MGFDASNVERYSGARLSFRETSYLNSVNRLLWQQQKLAREASGAERVLRSIGGMDQAARFANSRSSLALNAARLAGTVNPVGANRAAYYADLAKRIVPESMRPGFQLAAFRRNLAGMGHYTRLQSDALRYGKVFGNLGPSGAVAQAHKLQGIASAHSGLWSLYRVPSVRTPAIQSLLKSATNFGPIVISPDDEEEAPFDYHPNLQAWLIPQTATESGDTVDVEELRSQLVALLVSIVRDHRTKVLVRGLGQDMRMLLIQVAGTVIAIWLTQR